MPEAREGGLFRRLVRESRPFYGLAALCALLTFLVGGLTVAPPYILGDIVNRLTRGEPVNTWGYFALVVGVASLQGAATYAQGVAISTLGQRFLIATRDRLVGHLQRLPLAYFEKNQTGKIVSNVVNDAATINNLITTNGSQMLSDGAQLIFVIAFLFHSSPFLAFMALSVTPLYVWNFRRFWRPLQDTSDEIRGKRGRDVRGDAGEARRHPDGEGVRAGAVGGADVHGDDARPDGAERAAGTAGGRALDVRGRAVGGGDGAGAGVRGVSVPRGEAGDGDLGDVRDV